MVADLKIIHRDLADEHEELDRTVADLDDAAWDTPTPAVPWTVRDQISHLAFFDAQATLAITDPDKFQASLQDAALDIDAYMNRPLEDGRALDPAQVLEQWRTRRQALLEAGFGLDPSTRLAWYGPPMSPASFLTARLMEMWAHGQDVVDALGATRRPTDRLKHVAHLGVRTRGWSYTTNGKTPPADDVLVELTGPSGDLWTWGDSDDNRVAGSAVDFCLVVTQRRHLADTNLSIEGPLAKDWMSIAQAFAGPPGSGREAGRFFTQP
ncbi:MAG: TIGR03084 family metal-binding protein [Actinomycetota bacterium]